MGPFGSDALLWHRLVNARIRLTLSFAPPASVILERSEGTASHVRPVFDVDGLAGRAGSSLRSRMTVALVANDEVSSARLSARSATIRSYTRPFDPPLKLNGDAAEAQKAPFGLEARGVKTRSSPKLLRTFAPSRGVKRRVPSEDAMT